MSESDILTKYEVSLSQDVITDLMTPGKCFETTAFDRGDGFPTGVPGTVLLQKASDSIIKLLVTVYKPTDVSVKIMQTDQTGRGDCKTQTDQTATGEGKTQTDKTGTDEGKTQTDKTGVDEQRTQTDKTGVDEQKTQTDKTGVDEQKTQTDKTGVDEQKTQTDNTKVDEQRTQTEMKTVENAEQQTPIVESSHSGQQCVPDTGDTKTQTEPKQEQTSEMQTEIKEYREFGIQTECKQIVECGAQTEAKAISDSFMQTDIKEFAENCVQVCADMVESFMQTDIKEFKSSDVQATCEMTENVMQTDIKEFKSSDVQATCEMTENVMQTDIKEFFASDSQTEICALLRQDQDCQAVAEMGTSECQATVDMVEQIAQTFIDTQSVDIQTEVDQKEGCAQTDNPVLQPLDVQTDISFFAATDNESQTHIEVGQTDCQTDMSMSLMTESTSQTEIEATNIDSQTDMSMSLMNDGEAQTSVEQGTVDSQTDMSMSQVLDGDSQTDVSQVIDVDSQTDDTLHVEQQVEQQSQSNLPDTMPQIEQTGLDSYLEIGERPPTLDAETPTKKLEEVEDFSKGSQTDPVTIIIGDASFLVQKLKNSSMNPAKISGNEIEIEVNAEEEDASRRGYINIEPQAEVTQDPNKENTEDVRGKRKYTRKPKIEEGEEASPSANKRRGRPPRAPKQGPGVHESPAPVAPIPPPGSDEIGQFNCPVCPLTFHEAPEVYEHLQVAHSDRTVHRRPHGSGPKRKRRYKNTIAPTLAPAPDKSGEDEYEEAEPPMLQPFETSSGQSAPQLPVIVQQQAQLEPRLFEEPELPKTNARAANRAAYIVEDDGEDSFVQENYDYECPVCKDKFGSAAALYGHIKRAHKTQQETYIQEEAVGEDDAPDLVKQEEAAVNPGVEIDLQEDSFEPPPTEVATPGKRKRVSAASEEEPVKKGLRTRQTIKEEESPTRPVRSTRRK